MVPELAEVVLPPALEGRVILLASGLDALLRTTPSPHVTDRATSAGRVLLRRTRVPDPALRSGLAPPSHFTLTFLL